MGTFCRIEGVVATDAQQQVIALIQALADACFPAFPVAMFLALAQHRWRHHDLLDASALFKQRTLTLRNRGQAADQHQRRGIFLMLVVCRLAPEMKSGNKAISRASPPEPTQNVASLS